MEVRSDLVIREFERFRACRESCLQQMIDSLSRKCDLESIDRTSTVQLFKAYLLDPVVALHETAVVGLARFSSLSEEFALHVIQSQVLQQLTDTIHGRPHHFKSAVLYVMRAASKHSERTAQGVIDAGGLKCIVECLNNYDPRVVQSAARAVVNVVKHGRSLKDQVIDAGALPPLVSGLQNAYVKVKLYCACALGEMSQHSWRITEILARKNLITVIKCIENRDLSLRVLALRTLTTLCRCDISVVHNVLRYNILPYVIYLMRYDADMVKRNASEVLQEVTKRSMELSRLVANQGGIDALLRLVTETPSTVSLSGMIALSNMAGYCWELAMKIVRADGVLNLTKLLEREHDNEMLAATVHTLGQVAKHSPEHVRAFNQWDTFSKLIEIYNDKSRPLEVQTNCKQTLKLAIGVCTDVETLKLLLGITPGPFVKLVLRQFSLILPQDPCARRYFVRKGVLKAIQALDVEPESKASEYIQIIEHYLPEELVTYYGCGQLEDFLDQSWRFMSQQPRIMLSLQTLNDETSINVDDSKQEDQGLNNDKCEETSIKGDEAKDKDESLKDNILSEINMKEVT